jgi:hypothetical protein
MAQNPRRRLRIEPDDGDGAESHLRDDQIRLSQLYLIHKTISSASLKRKPLGEALRIPLSLSRAGRAGEVALKADSEAVAGLTGS